MKFASLLCFLSTGCLLVLGARRRLRSRHASASIGGGTSPGASQVPSSCLLALHLSETNHTQATLVFRHAVFGKTYNATPPCFAAIASFPAWSWNTCFAARTGKRTSEGCAFKTSGSQHDVNSFRVAVALHADDHHPHPYWTDSRSVCKYV